MAVGLDRRVGGAPALVPQPPLEADQTVSVRPWVTSEVDRLRTVLVHRPGRELQRLTPDNMHALLFDDVPWLERARAEHDAFADALRSRGVRVLELQELLAQTLTLAAGRAQVLDETLSLVDAGPLAGAALREWFEEMPARDLASALIAGVTVEELPSPAGLGLAARIGGPDGFVIPPLPNHLFTRDPAVWVGRNLEIARMARRPRQRERVHIEAIVRHHPLFGGGPRGAEPSTALPLEGGDVLVARADRILVGVSERTTASAVDDLATRLFRRGVREIVAFELPSRRATIHLDTLLTFADHDVVVAHPEFNELVKAWRVTPIRRGVRAERAGTPLDELPRVLQAPVQVVTGAPRGAPAACEQWTDGYNVLALSPGVVASYDRNERTNEALTQAGIEVIAFPGGELSRGRGGARCMSCPIEREPS